MKTSTEIVSIGRRVGYERAVEFVAKAGFDAYDLSLFDMVKYDWDLRRTVWNRSPMRRTRTLRAVRRLRRIAEDNGIRCNQSHAPFPSSVPQISSCFRRAIECTAEAGGTICIIHPKNDASPEENAEMYLELLPFAKEHGVKIAMENMYNWDREADHSVAAACGTPESFLRHLEAVGDPYCVACLDIGHAEMLGSRTTAPEMIRALGAEHLQALHVHDNDKVRDSHQIPGSMSIDFGAVTGALREIGYSGYLTLEADRYLKDFGNDQIFRGTQELARAARQLADAAEGK